MYKVDKKIPTPPTIRGKGLKYPFDQMEKGDSFFADILAARSAYAYGRAHKMRFTAAKEGDGMRIWRIK